MERVFPLPPFKNNYDVVCISTNAVPLSVAFASTYEVAINLPTPAEAFVNGSNNTSKPPN